MLRLYSGKLTLPPGNVFFLDAWFEQPDIYDMSGWQITNDTFPSLNTTVDENGLGCVVASVMKSQLLLRPVNCSLAYSAVCKAVKNTACNATTSTPDEASSHPLLDYIFDPGLRAKSAMSSQSMTKDIRSLFKARTLKQCSGPKVEPQGR